MGRTDARAHGDGEKDEERADGQVERRQRRREGVPHPRPASVAGRVRLAVARGRRLPGECELLRLRLAAVEADAEAGRGEVVAGEETREWEARVGEEEMERLPISPW